MPNPRTLEAYQLLHDGCVALAEVEKAGMPVDLEYCARESKRTLMRAGRLKEDIMDSDTGKLWKRIYGPRLNFNSPNQMRHIFFNILKLEPVGYTETGRPSLDAQSLDIMQTRYHLPFVQDFIRMKKLLKAEGTYLRALSSEAVDGVVHPFFSLHTVRSYRSSSSNPNFQNLPLRDPEMGNLVRGAIRAPEGYCIVENDYSGMEVGIGACSHRDRGMIEYITDKTKDMHRDSAMDLFKLEEHQVHKNIRQATKGGFVFPQFYGSYYIECAKNLFETVGQQNLTLTDGTPLREHMERVGLGELGACNPEEPTINGTFEAHVQDVERILWEERFPVFAHWRREIYDFYKDNLYFDSPTGFRYEGYFRRNEVINFGTQGSAFHCLLKAVIKLVGTLSKREMKTKVIGQIHDSIVALVHMDELQLYLDLVYEIMAKWVKKEWEWIIVPLEVDADVAPEGGSWAQKAEWVKTDGVWAPKKK
jgi:DNA polymerase I-like protein with 3'-5' exonuclease and polymerase domains